MGGAGPGAPAMAQGYQSEEERAVQFKWCYRCNKIKPPRTHHCSLCERCVLRMDHHCPWVGNCIGFHNHKFFINFTFWAAAATAVEALALVLSAFSGVIRVSPVGAPPPL